MKQLSIYDGENYILGKIALRDTYDFYNYLMVSTDGITNKNDPVINENGLVGLVESFNKKSAKVTLLTGKISLNVRVGNTYVILDGYDKKNNLLVVYNINNYKNVSVGDEVTTSGLTDIDANVYIGKVEKIITEGIEQIIYVKSEVDFDNLNYLYIVSKND